MSENTAIEWADHTFNPWIGCTKVGPGCDHCYAEAWQARFAGAQGVTRWGPGAQRGRTTPANWRKPLAWNAHSGRFLAEHGRRQRVFCSSLADVFDNEVDPAWRADLFRLIEDTPQLDWLLLTKRIGNVGRMMVDVAASLFWMDHLGECYLPPNVWLGATVVNQAEVDRDVPKLLKVPARVRFLSVEPMLGPISFEGLFASQNPNDGTNALEDLSWVICGGESGPHARPMSPDWARSLRDQCQAVGVPFLFKQWGEWLPMLGQAEGVPVGRKTTTDDGWVMGWAGKKAAGRMLDGQTHDGFPVGGAA
jgi:protein gp37